MLTYVLIYTLLTTTAGSKMHADANCVEMNLTMSGQTRMDVSHSPMQ